MRPHALAESSCMSVFVHIQLGAGEFPHRLYVSGAQPPLWRGPWGLCDSVGGSPCGVLMSACVVCRLERFAKYLGRREGKDGGVRVGDRKQRWSALCPHCLMETGGVRPTPSHLCQ